MRFRITFYHFPTAGKPYLSFAGIVGFDPDGNRYFRADHMSQFSSEIHMARSADGMIGTKNAGGQTYTSWELEVFPDEKEFGELLNRLAPVYPREVYAT